MSFVRKEKPVEQVSISKWIPTAGVYKGTLVNVSVKEYKPKESESKSKYRLDLMFMTDEQFEGLSHDYGHGQLAKGQYWVNPNKDDGSEINPFTKAVDNIRINIENIGALEGFDASVAGTSDPEDGMYWAECVKNALEGASCYATIMIQPTELLNDDGTTNVWNAPILSPYGSFIHNDEAYLKQKLSERKDHGILKLQVNNRVAVPTAAAEPLNDEDLQW